MTCGEKRLKLRPKKDDVLARLARNASKIVSHTDLLTAIRG